MSPIGLNDILDRNNRGYVSSGHSKPLENGDDTISFEMNGIASDETTPTGMTEEIVLLSWLLLLLRTREGGQVSFEWAFDICGTTSRLSMNEAMKGLEDNVTDVSAAIRKHIRESPDQNKPYSSPVPLILSTNTFAQNSEEVKEEVSDEIQVGKEQFSNKKKRARSTLSSDLSTTIYMFGLFGLPIISSLIHSHYTSRPWLTPSKCVFRALNYLSRIAFDPLRVT